MHNHNLMVLLDGPIVPYSSAAPWPPSPLWRQPSALALGLSARCRLTLIPPCGHVLLVLHRPDFPSLSRLSLGPAHT